MKPRVFVSSTFYDLKYIREDLSNYIKAHDFEPILFEDGDIGYTPCTPLDDSCYKAMESADMALLIVGGNYGSAATGENPQDFKDFISITRQEFRKGIEKGIPFYVFIDRTVYAEYGIYELNAKEIDSGECSIRFKSTKNINVFHFIKEIESLKQISITEFDKVLDIKEFLSKQWADMFKTYLSSMKEQKEIEQLQDSINNMNVLIEKMDKIMDAVGKEVLKNSHEEYQQIVEESEKAEAKSICLRLSKYIQISVDRTKTKKRAQQVTLFLTALEDMYIQQESAAEKLKVQPEDISLELANELISPFVESLESVGLSIRKLNFGIHEEINTIHSYLSSPDKFKEIYSLMCSNLYYYRIFSINHDNQPKSTSDGMPFEIKDNDKLIGNLE